MSWREFGNTLCLTDCVIHDLTTIERHVVMMHQCMCVDSGCSPCWSAYLTGSPSIYELSQFLSHFISCSYEVAAKFSTRCICILFQHTHTHMHTLTNRDTIPPPPPTHTDRKTFLLPRLVSLILLVQNWLCRPFSVVVYSGTLSGRPAFSSFLTQRWWTHTLIYTHTHITQRWRSEVRSNKDLSSGKTTS